MTEGMGLPWIGGNGDSIGRLVIISKQANKSPLSLYCPKWESGRNLGHVSTFH